MGNLNLVQYNNTCEFKYIIVSTILSIFNESMNKFCVQVVNINIKNSQQFAEAEIYEQKTPAYLNGSKNSGSNYIKTNKKTRKQ